MSSSKKNPPAPPSSAAAPSRTRDGSCRTATVPSSNVAPLPKKSTDHNAPKLSSPVSALETGTETTDTSNASPQATPEAACATDAPSSGSADLTALFDHAKQILGEMKAWHDANSDEDQRQRINNMASAIKKIEGEMHMHRQCVETQTLPPTSRAMDADFSAVVATLKDRVAEMQQGADLDGDKKQQIESMEKMIRKCAPKKERIDLFMDWMYEKDMQRRFRLGVSEETYYKDLDASQEMRRCRDYLQEQKAKRAMQETHTLLREAALGLERIAQVALEKLKLQAEQERKRLMQKYWRGKTIVEDGFPHHSSTYGDVEKGEFFSSFQVDLQRPENCIFRALQTLPPRKFVHGSTSFYFPFQHGSKTSYVDLAMREIARTYQQSCVITCEKDLTDSNPVFFVSRSPQEPMATIHIVDEPHDMLGDVARRQMSKHLTNLRLTHGVSAPIGIISSYDKWQFCWHKYASPVAEATTIEEVQRFCVPDLIDWDFSTLCVSPVYSYDNPCLLQLLASFLVKAAHIPSCAPATDPWLLYTRDKHQMRTGRLRFAKVRQYDMVPKSADELFLVKLLGRDPEGFVLQMATKSGECCAAKFCEARNEKSRRLKLSEAMVEREKLCQEELGRWVEAYGKDCGARVTQLAGRPVVLMPFYEPLSDADWEAPGTMKMVMDHIAELALRNEEEEKKDGTGKRKVFHINIERRHVVWGNKNHTRVRLIDWRHWSYRRGVPDTLHLVRSILASDSSRKSKKQQVMSHVKPYLDAVRKALSKPESEVEEPVVLITAPQTEDDYGEDFKTAFVDHFAELYDRDRAAFHAEMEGRAAAPPRSGRRACGRRVKAAQAGMNEKSE